MNVAGAGGFVMASPVTLLPLVTQGPAEEPSCELERNRRMALHGYRKKRGGGGGTCTGGKRALIYKKCVSSSDYWPVQSVTRICYTLFMLGSTG